MKPTCSIAQWTLDNTRVLLRADLNVPLCNGTIADDYRLRALLPTINLIHTRGGSIVLITHMGRPKGIDPALSTQQLIPWFTRHGLNVHFAADIAQAAHLSTAHAATKSGVPQIILLENLRFFPGEKDGDPAFAHALATLGDYYVNDSFATLHRADASIALLPTLFTHEKRSIGLLVAQELATLEKLRTHPKKPFVAVIGGGKVAEKLPLIAGLIQSADTILLCPAIVSTFLSAQGKAIGKSLIDPSQHKTCIDLLEQAHMQQVNVAFPLDYQLAHDTITGPLIYRDARNLPADGIIISIGPRTIAAYTDILMRARTIFFNAAMGFASRPETLIGAQALIKTLAHAPGYTVVGGGDSVALVEHLGLTNDIDYLSTGGGASLAYISGEELPGLRAFT